MSAIKKILINILATTCFVQLLLIFTPIIIDGASVNDVMENHILVSVILQILGVNTLLFTGLFFIHKLESKHAILEYLLDISYIIIVLLVYAVIFNVFSGRPWILAIMAVAGYIFGLLTNMYRARKDADELNKLLKKYKEKTVT
ncbi:MAG: hypothetical protein LBH42_03735 [Treponema sp.]|jgi:hypothetical protein|nr:hypothetical protein [Treponema sp.]